MHENKLLLPDTLDWEFSEQASAKRSIPIPCKKFLKLPQLQILPVLSILPQLLPRGSISLPAWDRDADSVQTNDFVDWDPTERMSWVSASTVSFFTHTESRLVCKIISQMVQ